MYLFYLPCCCCKNKHFDYFYCYVVVAQVYSMSVHASKQTSSWQCLALISYFACFRKCIKGSDIVEQEGIIIKNLWNVELYIATCCIGAGSCSRRGRDWKWVVDQLILLPFTLINFNIRARCLLSGYLVCLPSRWRTLWCWRHWSISVHTPSLRLSGHRRDWQTAYNRSLSGSGGQRGP